MPTMEFSFRRCRRTARQALQGRALAAAAVRWMPAAVFALLAAGEAGACRLGSALPLAAGAEAYWIPAMAGAFTLALWGVFFPVFWGMRRWFWLAATRKAPPVASVFHYLTSLRRYLRGVSLGVCYSLRMGGWALLTLAPGAGLAALCIRELAAASGFVAELWALGLVVGLAQLATGGCLLRILADRYLLTAGLALRYPQKGAHRLLSDSARIAGPYAAALFRFRLRFCPWFFAAAGVLPLAVLLPRLTAATAVFGEMLLTRRAAAQAQAFTVEFSAPGRPAPALLGRTQSFGVWPGRQAR